ncbi:BQ2448_4319 [Microbotryum intermedium]|uniref:BQ2448_4319 protein n=1 Tax=Microbotryum intermedium TaxID=269621 RepID=A0A238FG44_9BASI|nr:BQ2448_4319 [Microbotryum intermedium]
MSGLSLWLSPPESSPLAGLLLSLSKRHKTVQFKPHATLVSDAIVPELPIAELVKRIGEAIKRWRHERSIQGTGFQVNFMDVRQGELFYQCVLAALVPDPHLIALHEALLSSFAVPVPSPPTYFPHLSLVYGDLSHHEKDEIIKGMKERREVEQGDGECHVVGEKGFRADEVLLVRTRGSTGEWEVLAKVQL